MTDLLTVGDVAKRLGVARTRVEYAIEKAGIQEKGRAGILRLFAKEQISVIEAALNSVRGRPNADKSGGETDE